MCIMHMEGLVYLVSFYASRRDHLIIYANTESAQIWINVIPISEILSQL